MERLVIWGASGHASVVADTVRREGRYELAGFIADGSDRTGGMTFSGLPLLGGREILGDLESMGIGFIIVAVGHCPFRNELARIAEGSGMRLACAVHPSAVIAPGVELGEGSFVAAGAVINPGSRIGRNVIVNTQASIDHDCRVGSGAHVCPGVRFAGGVTAGSMSWTGIGTTAVSGISIGEGAFIGAGSLLISDVPPWTLAYGSPARPVRELDRQWSGVDLSGAPSSR